MVQSLILQILSGILGIWLATQFVSGVEFTGPIQSLLLAGLVLGLINFFIKPVIKLITLPLKLLTFGPFITFGLFSIIINMGMVWMVDVLLSELIIPGIIPLFWTTIIVWGLSIIFSLFSKGTVPKIA